ncbi:hypothetical protein Ndes2526A_g00898 [Nannochloris sp. 'desiccata']
MLKIKPLGTKRTQPRCLPTTRSHVYRRLVVHAMPVVCSAQGPTRKLIIMRHADSEDPKQLPGVRDHDRPITAGGKDAAKDIADQIKAAGWLPDVFICSNAVRSRETFEAIREHLPETDYADIHFLGSLYTISQLDGQTRGHLQEVVIGEATASHNCVLCLGHNKGWQEAASSFAGETLKLGNCYAALLEGSGKDWKDAFEEDARWKLVSVLRPKE